MLAIVIPYHRFEFFEKTLESLANQTDKGFYVYIGNDASPNDPQILLNKFKGQFDFTYKYFPENFGSKSLVSQWNRCLEMTKGEEWMMILGDDDVLSANCIEAFYRDLSYSEDINVVRFATIKIDAKGEQISQKFIHPQVESVKTFLLEGKRSSLSEHIFRSEKLKEIGFKDFPHAWFSDSLAILEVADFEYIQTINDATVFVRISELSISGSSVVMPGKVRAAAMFYIYLLKKYSNKFLKAEIIILQKKLNKTYLNNRRNLALLSKIVLFHLSSFNFGALSRFLKKCLATIK